MINGWLALVVGGGIFVAYWVGYYQAREDAKAEASLRNRQKFDTIKAMNYTKRGH